MFQAKNNIRNAPASSALTLVSHQSQGARKEIIMVIFQKANKQV